MSTTTNPVQLILEIRPGEGGADATDFAVTLAEVFMAYARRHQVTTDITPGRTTLITFADPPADFDLNRFCGTHRIQRIPSNDASSRRHTSTATVALLNHAPTPTTALADSDLRVDVYRGHGKGGQHRNKTDSAVRLTHLPTGTVVTVERGRSQAENLATARATLTDRLSAQQAKQHTHQRNAARNAQISTGTRPVKQWTWNTQRSQVHDHTSGTRYPLKDFLRGRLD